jgi:hypothetical protein
MANDLRSLMPSFPEPELEILEIHQMAYDFYDEVRHRQAFEQYCQWYYETAANHREEARKMQGDINVLGWFCRGRR